MPYRNSPVRDVEERYLYRDRDYILRTGREHFIKSQALYDHVQEMNEMMMVSPWRSLRSLMMWLIMWITFFVLVTFFVYPGLRQLGTFEDHAKIEKECALGKDSILVRGQSGCADFEIYGPLDLYSNRQGTLLSIEDLILEWQKLRNKTIDVVTSIKCDDKDYCHFVLPAKLGATVQVDIESLSLERRHHVILDCHDRPCEMYVTGTVDGQDFIAEEALDNALNWP